ncbi:hypothetical protein V5O48_018524, partial [Marasmius crinis-equi]
DAYILGAIISATNCIPEDVPHILATYDSIRRPFGNRSVLAAHKQGMYYESNTSEFRDIDGQVSTLVESIAAHWFQAITLVDSKLSRATEMATGRVPPSVDLTDLRFRYDSFWCTLVYLCHSRRCPQSHCS